MPLRFIDTDFFKHPFVRGLKGAYKSLYVFIFCDCDNAGIWNPEFEISSIYIDQKVDRDGAERHFAGKYILIPNGKWFLPDFIQWQHPNGLQEYNPAHKKIIKTLNSFNLIDSELKVIVPSKVLASPFKGSKDKDKEEGMDKVMVMEEAHPIQKLIAENLAQVKKLDRQITAKECETISGKYSMAIIEKVLNSMENHKQLTKKYKSVYLTLNKWCETESNSNYNGNFKQNNASGSATEALKNW